MSLARGVKICNRFTKPKGILSILEWLSKLLSSWDRAKRTHFNWQRWSTGPPFRFNYAALVLLQAASAAEVKPRLAPSYHESRTTRNGWWGIQLESAYLHVCGRAFAIFLQTILRSCLRSQAEEKAHLQRPHGCWLCWMSWGGLTTTVTKKGQNTRLITRALVMQKPNRRSRETTQ